MLAFVCCFLVVVFEVVVVVVVQPVSINTPAHAISAIDFFITLVLSECPDYHNPPSGSPHRLRTVAGHALATP
jgi:hypothetical protein